MIDNALDVIVQLINDYIGATDPEVVMGSISLIDAFQDSSAQNLTDKVIASVINIEQESTLRNLPFRRTVPGDDGLPKGIERPPEIYLNVYILFGANKGQENYKIALQRISQIIGFFQRQHVFTPENTPALSTASIEKLIFDLYSASFEELNHVWSINGTKYIPSVIYKMRMVIIQHAEESEAGVIKALGTTPNII